MVTLRAAGEHPQVRIEAVLARLEGSDWANASNTYVAGLKKIAEELERDFPEDDDGR